MNISPNSGNNITITSERGLSIEISDDGGSISIRKSKDPKIRKIEKISGAIYNYNEHHGGEKPDVNFNVDIIRIDP